MQSASDHECGANEPQRDDARDRGHYHSPALTPSQLAEHHAYEDRDADQRDLRRDREHRRHDERDAIGVEKGEQPDERSACGLLSALGFLLARHVLVGYGSCWKRCRTCPRAATSRFSPTSATRSPYALRCSTCTRPGSPPVRVHARGRARRPGRLACRRSRGGARAHRSARPRRRAPARRRDRRRAPRAARLLRDVRRRRKPRGLSQAARR